MPATFLRGMALLHFGAQHASAQGRGAAGCPCLAESATIQSKYSDTSTGSTQLKVDIGGAKYL
jgi:hypothetical protein